MKRKTLLGESIGFANMQWSDLIFLCPMSAGLLYFLSLFYLMTFMTCVFFTRQYLWVTRNCSTCHQLLQQIQFLNKPVFSNRSLLAHWEGPSDSTAVTISYLSFNFL